MESGGRGCKVNEGRGARRGRSGHREARVGIDRRMRLGRKERTKTDGSENCADKVHYDDVVIGLRLVGRR